MDHKITVESPFNYAPNAEIHGADPHQQHFLVEKALKQLLEDPFEANVNLAGREISLTVHSDGLHVTAELLPRRAQA